MLSRGWVEVQQGEGDASIMQDGTVDLQHGTRMDGNLHPCINGHYPVRVFIVKDSHILNHCILYNTEFILFIFFLCRLKINYVQNL